MNPALIAAQAIQRALRQRGVFYTHPTEGTADVFTTESMATLIEEAYAAQVKPLVWTPITVPEFKQTYHTANVGLGRYYRIVQCPANQVDFVSLWTEAKDMEDPSYDTVNGTYHPTLEAAQAAAQEEWSRFILSALQ